MKWTTKTDKWRRWFAWLPVCLTDRDCKTCVWLRWYWSRPDGDCTETSFTNPAHPAPAGGDAGNHKLDTDTHVFFYEQDFYVLSNFSAFSLQWDGWRFDTSEAAYHYEKFKYDSPEICEEIRNAPSAHEAFKIAERNKHLRHADWDLLKIPVMRAILHAKADQHEYVRRKLLATGDRILVEDSWRDDYWGWGPNRDGQNMLGKLWMEVRAALTAKPGAEG